MNKIKKDTLGVSQSFNKCYTNNIWDNLIDLHLLNYNNITYKLPNTISKQRDLASNFTKY